MKKFGLAKISSSQRWVTKFIKKNTCQVPERPKPTSWKAIEKINVLGFPEEQQGQGGQTKPVLHGEGIDIFWNTSYWVKLK